LRTMQRPSNLAMLNMSDVTEHEGTYRLYIYKSKTDQLMVGHYIVIEQSQWQYSVFRLITIWLKLRKHMKARPQDPFFVNSNNERISKKDITTAVRTVAQASNIPDDKVISGRSLRSGGATWLALSGIDHSTIKAIGNWKSDAIMHYLAALPSLNTSISQQAML